MLRLGRAIPFVLSVLAIAAAVVVLGVSSGDSMHARPLFGFNESAGQSTYALQTRVGPLIRRLPVGWNEVEPAPGIWRWGPTDSIYRGLRRAGLRPLFVAAAPPCWAHPSSPCTAADVGGTPPDPAYDGAWAEFVRRLADRYPQAAGIEIWNEENIQPAFLPYPNPARYTQLLQEAYRAVRHVSHRLPVVSGGLFTSAYSGPYGIGDAQFLAGMYAAGAKGFMNGIGDHVYPISGPANASPAQAAAALDRVLRPLRAITRAAHDQSTPIWITEIGVSTTPGPGSALAVTERQQAADLVAMVRRLSHERDIAVVIIHRLEDPGPEAAATPGNGSGYGVFRSDGSPKPAACALSAVFHGRLTC